MPSFRNADEQSQWLRLRAASSYLFEAVKTLQPLTRHSGRMLEIMAVHTELLAEAVEMAAPPQEDADVTPGDRLVFNALRQELRAIFESEPDLSVAASVRASFERIEAAQMRIHATEGLFPPQTATSTEDDDHG
ncbi:MAG: hypothetical protein AAGA54_35320 [Myxococcota bacterium]